MSVLDRIVLAFRVSEQCALWCCPVQPQTPESIYCHEGCLAMATSYAQSKLPACTATVYSSPTKFADVAAKILKSLRSNVESGVPQFLSQDLLQTPPWESNMFNFVFTRREEYCQWLFIGLYPIPNSSGFKWKGGRVKMIGEVSHCLFKPFPKRQDGKWKLHQYSSPDLMGKAVYLMHCNK